MVGATPTVATHRPMVTAAAQTAEVTVAVVVDDVNVAMATLT